jgi:hypothetical protein
MIFYRLYYVTGTEINEKDRSEVYSTTQVSGKIAAETGGFRRRFKRQSALLQHSRQREGCVGDRL